MMNVYDDDGKEIQRIIDMAISLSSDDLCSLLEELVALYSKRAFEDWVERELNDLIENEIDIRIKKLGEDPLNWRK